MLCGKELRGTGGRLFIVIIAIIVLIFVAAAYRLHNNHPIENAPLVDQGR